MARRQKKYHFIYKTTNKLNGKYYIGMHSTDNLDDGYLGSGKRLRYSVRKYGEENFEREILEFFDTREELREREEEVVNLDEIAKKDCMNLQIGGGGGFANINHMMKCSKAGIESFKKRLDKDVELQEKYRENGKKQMGLLHKNGKVKYGTSFKGRSHSDESKTLISKAKKGTGVGSENSQFGKVWITDEKESVKINKSDPIPEGWRLGRKMKSK